MFRPTLKRGLSRTAVVLAGPVLALALLSPASALAKAGGTDRPVKGTASGNVTVRLGAPLRLTIDLTGVATQFGKYSVHLEADAEIIGGEVVAHGPFTVVAANGDRATGTFKVSGPLPSGTVHATTAVLTITGGTGRFADASGTITSQNLVTPTCIAAPSCPGLLLETLEGRLSGQISYGDSLCAKKYKTSDGLVRHLGGVHVSCSRAKKVARYWLKHHCRAPSGWKLRYTDGDPNVIVKRRGTSRSVYWNHRSRHGGCAHRCRR